MYIMSTKALRESSTLNQMGIVTIPIPIPILLPIPIPIQIPIPIPIEIPIPMLILYLYQCLYYTYFKTYSCVETEA